VKALSKVLPHHSGQPGRHAFTVVLVKGKQSEREKEREREREREEC
jgi:hypothetical protein